jgi:hypothetical protein
MKGREFKRIWGYPWDYAYLLQIEKRKLQEMIKYISKTKRHLGWEFQVRDMQICVKLIDIILANDVHYKSWMNATYGGDYTHVKFPVHINTRNYKRFYPTYEGFDENSEIYWTLVADYRVAKAMYLYNKIRAYKMFEWWD